MATKAGVLALPLLIAAVTLAIAQSGEGAGRLPAPSGGFGIGRVTLLCTDAKRLEPLDANRAARRVVVDVWYPAERVEWKASSRASYLDVDTFERALGFDGLKAQLGGAYAAVRAGRAVTHASVGAPFARSVRMAPLLLFSPGGGMIRELYTAQMEDLASHGYIVAAMTHSYDGFLAVFPDGSSVAHDSKRWPAIPSVEGEANRNQLEWHTDDMLVVLNELMRIHAASALPFAGHMDFTKVGAFGHSSGGVAAAHACQRDQRIQACLNEDGAMGMKPFYPDAQGWGMNQAFLLLERPPNREPLTDADLASMHLTRQRAWELIARLNAGRDHLMRSTGRGSYRVLLRRNATTHIDFTDLRVLSAKDRDELDERTRVLAVVRQYTRAFFDRYVRGEKESLLDRGASGDIVEAVERFGPGRRIR